MAWDPSRPVPWQRLTREWLLYVGLMGVIFLVFFRPDSPTGVVAGLLVSGPMYLAFGYVLAKFGYQRKTLRQLRTDTRDQARSSGPADSATPRPKPAPTKRTGGGSTGRPTRRR